MTDGKPEEEAKRLAPSDWLSGFATDLIGGFISGDVMTSTFGGIDLATRPKNANTIQSAAQFNTPTNMVELLTLEGRQAAGMENAETPTLMDGFHSVFDEDGGTKNTTDPMGSGEKPEPVALGDTEEQRYQKLKDRKILVMPYDAEKLQQIGTEDYAKLQGKANSTIYEFITGVAKKYGLYKEYLNVDVSAEFAFSGNKMAESAKKQKTDYQNQAKVLTVLDKVMENAICIKKETDRYSLPNNNTDSVITFVGAVDARDSAMEIPRILPVLIAAKTFTDGTKNNLHMVISIPEIKGSHIMGRNSMAKNTSRPRPLVALEYSLADILQNVNPHGWNKNVETPDGRFLKYVPDGFLDEMQKVAKQYALIEQKQYDRNKTIDKYSKMKRRTAEDELALQQMIRERESEKPKEDVLLKSLADQFRELAEADELEGKWLMKGFEEELDGVLP